MLCLQTFLAELGPSFLALYPTVTVTFTCERRAAVNFSCLDSASV